MKRKIAWILAGALCLSALAACGNKTDDKTIVVGASATPHAEILNAAKDLLAEKGFTLEVREFTDYVLPNTALRDGELDANYFQHLPYMNNFNTVNKGNLVAAIEMHYEPIAIYPGKTGALSALQDGATISVPNDPTNETRALQLLEAQGLITLRDGVHPETSPATVLDIKDNPKNFKFSEIAAEQLPRTLQDVDIAVINGNYALAAGLSVKDDALVAESSDYGMTYVNIVAVRADDENSDKVKALKEALHSDTVRQFIEDKYQGAVVPTF